MSACANPKCPNPARQRFAIYSWFQDVRRQTPPVYLVCDGCASEFFPVQSGRFDRAKAELIEGDQMSVLAREIEQFRSAHPSFGSVIDTLLELADDPTVTPEVYERVCQAIFTVLYAWLEARDA